MRRHRTPARLSALGVVVAVVVTACSASPDFAAVGSDDTAPTPTAPATASTAPDDNEPPDSETPVATSSPAPESQASPTPEPAPTATSQPEPTPSQPQWSLTIEEIDDETRARIEPTSWRVGCPVGLEGLRLLTFPYFDFDGVVKTGEMIVAAAWAEDLGLVFEALFDAEYPIQRIELVDEYAGNDDLSMQANNTSAFNCRQVAGKPGVWSNHALGEAVDLNPLMNPYVQGGFVAPPEGAEYLDRTDERVGMVVRGDEAVQAFEAIGWTWGGNWVGLKDYQHFSSNGR